MSKCSTCLKMSRYGYCDNMSSMDIGDRNPCVDGSMYEPRRFTNADRIRGMSDEELAEFIDDIQNDAFAADGCGYSLHFPDDKETTWIDWLRKPAGEVHDGQTI